MIRTGTFAMAIRGITIIARFLLLIYLVKELNPGEIGIFGIFSSTIALMAYVIGIEFYQFSNREFLSEQDNLLKMSFLSRQFSLHLLTYFFIVPLIFLIFLFDVLPFNLFLTFYLFLIFEHLNQEFTRIMFMLEKPIMANVILFIKNGFWVFGLILYTSFLSAPELNVKLVFDIWLMLSISSAFVAFIFLKKQGIKLKLDLNKEWIKLGVRSSIPFFLSTLSFKLIELSDRYIIQYFLGNELVGVYTFYYSLANVIQVFVFTGVISIFLPKAMKAYNQNKDYVGIMRELGRRSVLLSILLIAVSLIMINPLLDFTDNSFYKQYIEVYYFLFASMLFLASSFEVHYKLYIQRLEKYILYSSLISLVYIIVANIILIPIFGLIGAGISSCTSFLLLFFLKRMFYSRVGTI